MLKAFILTLVFTSGERMDAGVSSQQYIYPNAQSCEIAKRKWLSKPNQSKLSYLLIPIATCEEGCIVK